MGGLDSFYNQEYRMIHSYHRLQMNKLRCAKKASVTAFFKAVSVKTELRNKMVNIKFIHEKQKTIQR